MLAKEIALYIETELKKDLAKEYAKYKSGKCSSAVVKIHTISSGHLDKYNVNNKFPGVTPEIQQEAINIYNERNKGYEDWLTNLPPHSWDCSNGYQNAANKKGYKF